MHLNLDEDILEHLDVSSVRKPIGQSRQVNVDFPIWMVEHSTVKRPA